MADPKRDGLDAELLPILASSFPRAFFPSGRSCRPLRVGIFEDLNGLLPPEIDRARLRAYLGLYTGQPSYLRELRPGAIRIGLDGRTAGRVSAKEAASAAARLQKLHGVENGAPVAQASASCPASAPQISPAPLTAMHGTAINPLRTLFRTGPAEAFLRKKGARQGQQQVIVVVKKRKASGNSAAQILKP